jgi:hypothetical protein
MEYTLADCFSRDGAEGKEFIDPEGVPYIFRGFAPAEGEETENQGSKMRIKRQGAEGDLEELVDIGPHIGDVYVVTEPVAGRFYKSVSSGDILFYDGENLVREGKERLDLSQETVLIPIDEAKTLETLDQQAGDLYGQYSRKKALADFIRAYSTTRTDTDDRAETPVGDTASKQSVDTTEGGEGTAAEVSLEDSQTELEPVGEGSAGTAAEASLEEIEDDVNLDSFGSGSGLLDLSLQADDTSLGGILDEIYTTEGGEGAAGTLEEITLAEEPPEDTTGEGTAAEASREDDVNLDSFGSGSGLLDLSLQADDTSLGGILDEVYTAEGGEGAAGPAKASPGDTTVHGVQPPTEGRERVQVKPSYSAEKPEAHPKPRRRVRTWLRAQWEETKRNFF